MISREANRISDRIIGGRIFGELITKDSPIDLIIVAAYYLGRSEEHTTPMPWYDRKVENESI
jgi:hypothetical protein